VKFPIVVKNTLETWQTIGRVWLPPFGCLSVSEMLYRQNEDKFGFALESGRIVILDSDAADAELSRADDLDEESTETHGSIVQAVVDGDMHWRTAQKEIEQIDDVERIDELLVEAKHYGMSEESAVYRALSKRFDELIDSL
jgi:hypothetical protein